MEVQTKFEVSSYDVKSLMLPPICMKKNLVYEKGYFNVSVAFSVQYWSKSSKINIMLLFAYRECVGDEHTLM